MKKKIERDKMNPWSKLKVYEKEKKKYIEVFVFQNQKVMA